MPLPDEFTFTQSNLQDYVECPRRFELRYVLQRQWPAVEAEPLVERERHMQQGATFHHMVHQHSVGVPEDVLSQMATDSPLKGWWDNYLQHGLDNLPATRHPEIVLRAPLGDYRVLAKIDLLALDSERAVIVDWKTATRRPKREHLAKRLQTVVYPYVLVQAGAYLNGGKPFTPEQVEMVYWFADDPHNPERFAYSQAQYQADESTLLGLVEEITARTAFDLTAQEWRCKFCTYRSLCNRGISAGDADSLDESLFDDLVDEDDGIDFDFDQIAEVTF